MTLRGQKPSAASALRVSKGFTLVELLIGATLSAAVMAAVFSSYLYLGRSLARLANQQTLETEARRALGYFTQDVEQATGVDSTGTSPKVLPDATKVTLTLPSTSTVATNYVTYTYDSTAATLTRTPAGGTAQILLRNITSLSLGYYDSSGNKYTSYTDYLAGIKQLSLEFSTQTGSAPNGTRTPVLQVASGRLILRNRGFLQ